jgi:ComF family protein
VVVPRVFSHLLDFCYPGVCAHCDAGCPGSSTLCDECAQQLTELAGAPACAKCASPLTTDNAPCPWCHGAGLTPIERIVRLGVFTDPLKSLIHRMKYNARWPLAEFLADHLAAQPNTRNLITSDTILIPVPLHYRRQFSRGYNQSDLLARRLKKKMSCRLSRPIRRIRDTPTQTHMTSRADREANVRDAFALTHFHKSIENRPIVIVDDVFTTGATLRAVARTLKQARPSSISAIVLAIADPRRRDFQTI